VGILAGVMFIVGDTLKRVVSDIDDVACASASAYLVNAVDLLKYGLTGVAMVLLVGVFRADLSRTGREFGRVGGLGFVVAGVANGIEHCAHLESFGWLYVTGLLIGLVATTTFGVMLARSGALPSWIGWVVSAGVLGFLLAAQQGGAFLVGSAMVAVGVQLSRGPFRHAPPEAGTH
jgi:hypothetical protein